ncbi:MAG: 3-oxoadipate enol-lactonase [Chitinophagales bacterium]
MAFTRCNEHIIHYDYLPKEGAKTVVFVNSLGTDFRIWDAVVDQLKEHYAILRFNKRGHGLSDVPEGPTDLKNYSDDLLCLLDQLNVEKIYLVGLSIGGMISMLFTSLYPDRVEKLVLSDTAPVIGNEKDWNARIRIIEAKGINFLAKGIIERWFAASFISQYPEATKGYQNMLERTTIIGYTAACGAIRDADLTENLKSILQPTLCICGSEDQSTPTTLVKEMTRQISNATYYEIQATGHLPCVEKPKKYSSILLNFFENGQ